MREETGERFSPSTVRLKHRMGMLRAIRNVGQGSHSGTHCYVRLDDDALELGIFAHLEKCLRGLGLGPRALMPLG